MEMRKGNGTTNTLLFSLKGLHILYQERRKQVNTLVMEHFYNILLHKSGPVNKQHRLPMNQISQLYSKFHTIYSN